MFPTFQKFHHFYFCSAFLIVRMCLHIYRPNLCYQYMQTTKSSAFRYASACALLGSALQRWKRWELMERMQTFFPRFPRWMTPSWEKTFRQTLDGAIHRLESSSKFKEPSITFYNFIEPSKNS